MTIEELEAENANLKTALANLYKYAADATDEWGDEGIRDTWKSDEFKQVLAATARLLTAESAQ